MNIDRLARLFLCNRTTQHHKMDMLVILLTALPYYVRQLLPSQRLSP